MQELAAELQGPGCPTLTAEPAEVLGQLDTFTSTLEVLSDKAKRLNTYQQLFEVNVTDFTIAATLDRSVVSQGGI